MPPKVRFTREDMVQAALELVAEQGSDALTARTLAERLGCSVKPIFGLFRNMEEVRQEVIGAAQTMHGQYMAEKRAQGDMPPYKASGMAYILFAKEHRELFRLLFMRNRSGEDEPAPEEDISEILQIIMQKTGLSREQAERFHLEMWIFVHGIASMEVTSYLNLEPALISSMLTDVFQGLLHRFCAEGRKDGSY